MARKELFLKLLLVVWFSLVSTSLWAQTGGFVYVANCGDSCGGILPGNVSAYSIDGSTGALAPVPGSPFMAGTNPFSVAVDPTGRFAYVANRSSNDVSAYTIDGGTGALTEIAGSPFAAGVRSHSVTVDPTGQFTYVANFLSDNVSAYTINGTTGALTPVAGSPFPAGHFPSSVTVDPTGQFAYVANAGDGISAYNIDRTTGALVAPPFRAGSRPASVTTTAGHPPTP